MNKENVDFKVVDFSNAKEAIEVQRAIFPEDGMLNILASLDRELFIKLTDLNYPDDNVKYYLAYNEKSVVGITGLYSYPGDEDEMWLAWFGVMPKYRGLGYGTIMLDWTMKEVKSRGRKILRLYTDVIENKVAVELYKKLGFYGEKYSKENLPYDCYIYSKNLVEESVIPWNNKNLELTQQSNLENVDEDRKKIIYNEYKEKYLKKV